MEKTESKLELIKKHFSQLSEKQLEQLSALDDLYKEWNSRINIISRKDIDQLYQNHVFHSLCIALIFSFGPGQHVIDIGTGGGFPGIPLAIMFPATSFHLVDSIGKKIKVVRAVSSSIGLENITTEHVRVEDIKRRKFDCAVSRAVAPLGELWHWAKPILSQPDSGKSKLKWEHVKPGQKIEANGLICLKGGRLEKEIIESKAKPVVYPIKEYLYEEYFQDKYILHVERTIPIG
jgi:16S rRNA (guanine527-N7)-methyltransferase